jgi:hypothetical protein
MNRRKPRRFERKKMTARFRWSQLSLLAAVVVIGGMYFAMHLKSVNAQNALAQKQLSADHATRSELLNAQNLQSQDAEVLSIRIYPVKADAKRVIELIKGLMPDIAAETNLSNSAIVVRANATLHQQLEVLLENNFDTSPEPDKVSVFQLENATASVVADVLSGLKFNLSIQIVQDAGLLVVRGKASDIEEAQALTMRLDEYLANRSRAKSFGSQREEVTEPVIKR